MSDELVNVFRQTAEEHNLNPRKVGHHVEDEMEFVSGMLDIEGYDRPYNLNVLVEGSVDKEHSQTPKERIEMLIEVAANKGEHSIDL